MTSKQEDKIITMSEGIIAEILIETIRSFPVQPEIDAVVKRLSKKGSLITREQAEQVFEENELEYNSGLVAVQQLQLCREQAKAATQPSNHLPGG